MTGRTIGAATAGLLSVLVLYAKPATADAPCEGAYRSAVRGCFGGAYVRRDTIEWNTPWSVCKPTPYEIIDSEMEGDQRRVVYMLKKPSKSCGYQIIEIEHMGDDYWSVNGYPTRESYEKRDDHAWIDAAEGRTSLSCPVYFDKPQIRCDIEVPKKTRR
ncbi:hypothetical protein QTH90_18350 [Variovorax sp. J2P1-59]|uniref:hypothetical protein n=1 Tax=Variovorax flavidus TaxID=3053501 RepID=UPI0025785169|nr:hypothetical protein [Variovorax sp. J2P1-59]MDM0076377.1 hypothetical protein [Variovorax sp. J2P1-59]